MALRFSPALQNFIAQEGSWKCALDEGSIEVDWSVRQVVNGRITYK